MFWLGLHAFWQVEYSTMSFPFPYDILSHINIIAM